MKTPPQPRELTHGDLRQIDVVQSRAAELQIALLRLLGGERGNAAARTIADAVQAAIRGLSVA